MERWAEFEFGDQILMIAAELHRASKLIRADDGDRRRNSLERVYALVDLTIACHPQRSRRRELLRWREMLGGLHLGTAVAPGESRSLLRALLQFDPVAARQIPYVAA